MEFHTAIKDKYSALYKSFSARILPRKASVLHVLQYLCGSCRIHLHIRCHHHYHDHHDNWKLHATKCNTHYSARPSTFCYVFGKIQSNILSAVCFVKMRSEYSMDDSPIFTILGSLTVVIHHYRTHTHTCLHYKCNFYHRFHTKTTTYTQHIRENIVAKFIKNYRLGLTTTNHHTSRAQTTRKSKRWTKNNTQTHVTLFNLHEFLKSGAGALN